MIKDVEFYTRPNGDVEVIELNITPYILDETKRHIITVLLDIIREDYPEAYSALSKRYEDSMRNLMYFEFLMARMFIKCNWSQYDNHTDINESGQFVFEFCSCPLRGECQSWKVICEPTRSTKISPAEMNVLRLIVSGKETIEIAGELHISIFTVNNHRNKMLSKLNLHNIAALTDYWHKNNLK